LFARISPGAILELWTEDRFAARVEGPGDLVSRICEFPIESADGPFYVEGAEPDDTLAVHFISITPARGLGGVQDGASVRRADLDAPDRYPRGRHARGRLDLGA